MLGQPPGVTSPCRYENRSEFLGHFDEKPDRAERGGFDPAKGGAKTSDMAFYYATIMVACFTD